MFHAVAYILFILPFTAWLGYELKIKYSLKAYTPWLIGAFATGIIGAVLSNLLLGKTGNFVLHASGGFASTLLFIYLIKTLNLRFSFAISTLLLFGFVCSLGVLNELLEYSVELASNWLFSFDSHDTWRDLTANTTGAVLAWSIYNLYILARKNKVL